MSNGASAYVTMTIATGLVAVGIAAMGRLNPAIGERLAAIGPRRLLVGLIFGWFELGCLIQLVIGPELSDRISYLIVMAALGGVGWFIWRQLPTGNDETP
jgi:hypothetical protein